MSNIKTGITPEQREAANRAKVKQEAKKPRPKPNALTKAADAVGKKAKAAAKVAPLPKSEKDAKVAASVKKAKITAAEAKKLTVEQRDRAVLAADKKPGLSGAALKKFIIDGTELAAQMKDAKAKAAAEGKVEKTVRRAKDPEAAEVAARAKALAPNLKSAYIAADGREFLDQFKVTRRGAKITVTRGKVEQKIDAGDLEKFGVDGEKNKEVRAALSELSKDSRLYGRKLALLILASQAKK